MFNAEPEIVELEAKLIGNLTDPERIAEIRAADEYLKKFSGNFPRTMSARQCGKKSNHGLNYAEGFRKFALINEIDESEAKRIVEMYHLIYPGIRLWYEIIKRQLQQTRSLTNCFGRKVRFMDQWGEDLWKAAYSMLPQSSVVDSLNIGLVKIYEDDWLCGLDQLNIDVLAQVHDSILLQVPTKVVADPVLFAEVQELCYNYVSPTLNYNGREFKIATDSKMGLNWGGYHKDTNPRGMREVKNATEATQWLESLSVARTT